MEACPILLIHAFPFDGRMWRAQVDAFRGTRKVLAPDLRGFGSHRAAPFPTTVEQHAKDCLALLDRSGLPRAAVIGLSMGGYVALAMHRLAKERFEALMLCDTKADPDTPAARIGREARIARVGKEGCSFLADEMLPSLVASGASEDVKLELRRILLEQDPQGVQCALAALRDRPDSNDVLPDIRVPCTLLCGELDVLTPPNVMGEMARRIEGASFVTVPNAGHMTCVEEPEAFNRALQALLQRTR
ncbi:MAG TPA: alpha/beta fold hydrolase [Polyangiaceae bacterium]|nr:alpha/beta fold hydrolase [Polyangiaceae bacterium]